MFGRMGGNNQLLMGVSMAYVTTSTTASTRPGLLARVGNSILDALVFLAEMGPRSEALRRLSTLSNDELARRGTTREAEVRRIMGPSFI